MDVRFDVGEFSVFWNGGAVFEGGFEGEGDGSGIVVFVAGGADAGESGEIFAGEVLEGGVYFANDGEVFKCLFAEVSGSEGVGRASDDEVEFDFKLEVADLALNAGGGVVDGSYVYEGAGVVDRRVLGVHLSDVEVYPAEFRNLCQFLHDGFEYFFHDVLF